ncbi:MAG: cytochrome c2 [Hyphomicrobiaceae bacterium]|nr:MAG: cytochrome c2 [Hyphomicrobiaceae bacterium]
MQGPSLYRVIGRSAGTLPGFEYSPAMIGRGAAGLVWDAASLDLYLADPEGIVPGTSMSIPPLRDEQDRADVIAYLAAAARR